MGVNGLAHGAHRAGGSHVPAAAQGRGSQRNVPTCHRVRTRDVIGRRPPAPASLCTYFPPWSGRARASMHARDVQWAPIELRVAIIGSRASGPRSVLGSVCSYARARAGRRVWCSTGRVTRPWLAADRAAPSRRQEKGGMAMVLVSIYSLHAVYSTSSVVLQAYGTEVHTEQIILGLALALCRFQRKCS